jgi:hypothetical protein
MVPLADKTPSHRKRKGRNTSRICSSISPTINTIILLFKVQQEAYFVLNLNTAKNIAPGKPSFMFHHARCVNLESSIHCKANGSLRNSQQLVTIFISVDNFCLKCSEV